MSTVDNTAEVAPAATELTNCPACGSHVLFTVELEYGGAEGFRPDYFGVTPLQGDTVSRCDSCGAFYVHPIATTKSESSTTEISPASKSTNVDTTAGAAGVPDLAAIEQVMLAKLGELEQTLGVKVNELEQQLANEQAAHAATQQALDAASSATPAEPTQTPPGALAAPQGASESVSAFPVVPPETAATPDTPNEGGTDGTPEGA